MPTSPSGGRDYAVDPAKLSDAIAQLTRSSHDFGAVTRDYQGAVCYSPAAFGEFGVDDAWAKFDSSWAAELRQTAAALTELIQDFQTAAGGYQLSDAGAARSMRTAGPR